MLGPSIDQDNLIVDHVSLREAILHFLCIFWKLVFAIVPPVKIGGGWPAFWVALGFIGVITAIVKEVATLFGCAIGI